MRSSQNSYSTSVERIGLRGGPGLLQTPALTGGGAEFLLPRRRTEDLRSISGTDGSQPLHLGFVGRLLRLGRNGQ